MLSYSAGVPGLLQTRVSTSCACAQIYVEIERARLTRQLATIQEDKGDVAAAADTLQEVAVVSSFICGGQVLSLSFIIGFAVGAGSKLKGNNCADNAADSPGPLQLMLHTQQPFAPSDPLGWVVLPPVGVNVL